MIRDAMIDGMLPLSGTGALLLSGIISFGSATVTGLLGTTFYFFLAALCISAGGRWITGRIRTQFRIRDNAWPKVLLLCSAGFFYGVTITALLSIGWLAFSPGTFSLELLLQTSLISAGLTILFMLVYEILLMSRERVLDAKVVDQLDHERMVAELSALTQELDPHFMFNSLTTLSQLITCDPGKAAQFTSRLSQVYKYMLLNRNQELVTLQKELEFIEDYFFLLQIRHDNRLQLDIQVRPDDAGRKLLPPCALQMLVENAIKHNHFTDTLPLNIRISLNGSFIRVINNVRPKAQLEHSTRVGLRNLSGRYRLLCRKDIIVENTPTHFMVKLPLILNNTFYDPRRNH